MEKVSSKKYEIDMCNGPLLGKILIFYVPLMLSGILQLLLTRRISWWWGDLPGMKRWRRWAPPVP